MANTGRYTYCPAAGRVRRRISFADWLRKRKAMRARQADLFTVGDYYPACYPAGYKK